MTDLNALLERVKAATAPDRELDQAIFDQLLGGVFDETTVGQFFTRVRWDAYPVAFTTSIDAALALTERVLPGWMWLKKSPAVITVYCPLTEQEENDKAWAKHFDATGNTMPLAILAATLSALIAKDAA